MSTPTQPPYQYLRRKIREWQAGDLLRAVDQRLRQFRAMAPVSLLPLVKDLQQALDAEGLWATVREMSLDLGVLSLTIDDFDIEVSFEPCEAPDALVMTTCRMGCSEPAATRLLAYQDLDTNIAGVMGHLQEAVLCALDPRRASTHGIQSGSYSHTPALSRLRGSRPDASDPPLGHHPLPSGHTCPSQRRTGGRRSLVRAVFDDRWSAGVYLQPFDDISMRLTLRFSWEPTIEEQHALLYRTCTRATFAAALKRGIERLLMHSRRSDVPCHLHLI